MPLAVAQLAVTLVELYVVAGVLFALVFLWRGIHVVDHRVVGAPFSMRVLILPGLVALWPVFARRWVSGAGEPVERTPHRSKASDG